ncbi:hypothetical protein AZE42_01226 [Rhizopogon vesiculosus]|uniref:Uncharacterized protein n=1 Tax=Rhizopogon vesiculosus TaxID=180088 RepID=A0A1J8Q9B2_9AGAM|nr:hypothetical protein AZE42_01226 [Rhizopogon vesiculosus]
MNASIFLFLLIARVAFVKASSADVEELETVGGLQAVKFWTQIFKSISASQY